MHAKTNRLNSDFQIAYFLAGSCHTPDGAYALLCDLREERQMALNAYEVSQIRLKAKKRRAEQMLESLHEDEQDEGRAILLEIALGKELSDRNYTAAKAELATIEQCIELVNPLRRFKHLPDHEAHQAAQRDEWRLELIHRAENFLMTIGTIPTDHFATMRQHPDFATKILPVIDEMSTKLTSTAGQKELAKRLTAKRDFDLPKLMGHDPSATLQ